MIESHDDDDLTAVAPTLLVRVGGGALMMSGLLTALLGLQLILSVRATGVFGVVPLLWMVVGIGSIAVGWQVGRARDWAAITGATIGAMLVVGHVVWIVLSFSHGLFSLMALANVPVAFAGAIGAGLAIPGCRRSSDARMRLRASGMDVGI